MYVCLGEANDDDNGSYVLAKRGVGLAVEEVEVVAVIYVVRHKNYESASVRIYLAYISTRECNTARSSAHIEIVPQLKSRDVRASVIANYGKRGLAQQANERLRCGVQKLFTEMLLLPIKQLPTLLFVATTII